MTFNVGGQSPSESHYITFGSGITNAVIQNCVTVMTARMAMMGAGVTPISGRISVVGNPRTYYLLDPASFVGMPPGGAVVQVSQTAVAAAAGAGNTVDNSADEANSAIHLFGYNSDFSKHSRHYLAGVPDVMVRTNPNGPWIMGDSPWVGVLNQYITLIAGAGNVTWGFMTRTPVTTPNFAPVIATGISQSNVTALISVTCPTITGVNIQSYVQLRGWAMTSRAYIPINGTYQVSNVVAGGGGQSTYTLNASANVAFAQILTWGTVQQIAYQFAPYAKMTVTKQGTHKRGKSAVGPRGSVRKPSRVSF